MNHQDFLKRLSTCPLIGVLRAPNRELAEASMSICIEEGLLNLEVTYSTPEAEKVMAWAKEKYPQALIGAGTVLTVDHFEKAVKHSADFFVSPHLEDRLVHHASQESLVYLPGCLTPSELMKAYLGGCHVQKLFPAHVHGPSGIQALRGPLPFLNLVVTGGVSLKTAGPLFEAGAVAVCVGSQLFSDELWKNQDWNQFRSQVRQWIETIRPFAKAL